MLRFELVEIGSGGQAPCARCGPTQGPVSYVDTDVISARIHDAVAKSATPGPNVMLGGVEAFGHPALPAVVGMAVREGVVRLGLQTDGGPLTTGGNAGGAIHAGVRHIQVRHADRARAVAGISAWRAAAEEAGVDAVATAVITVCSHNLPEVPLYVAEMAQAGVAGVVLDARSATVSEALSRSVVSACDTGTVNGVWVEVAGPDTLLPESHAVHRVRAVM